MAKKKNVLVTILKVVLSIIGIIALLLVGAYCFLKFAMGIDIFEIKIKLDLLNQPVNEQTLITKPYDEENGFIIRGNRDNRRDGFFTYKQLCYEENRVVFESKCRFFK